MDVLGISLSADEIAKLLGAAIGGAALVWKPGRALAEFSRKRKTTPILAQTDERTRDLLTPANGKVDSSVMEVLATMGAEMKVMRERQGANTEHIATLESQLADAKTQLYDVQRKLRAVTGERDTLQERVRELEAKVHELEQELSRAKGGTTHE